MNIFEKLKRWFSRHKVRGNQAPSYISTGHESPRRPKRGESSRNPVMWMGAPFSPIVVNFTDPIDQNRRR